MLASEGESAPPGRTNQASRLSDQIEKFDCILQELEKPKGKTKQEVAQMLREELRALRKAVLEQDIMNAQLTARVDELRLQKRPAAPAAPAPSRKQPATAAEAVSRGLPRKANTISKVVAKMVTKVETKVIIVPEKEGTMEETRALLENIDPEKEGFKVVRMAPHKDKGGVAIHLSSAEGAQKLRSADLKKHGLRVQAVERLTPRVVVYDVPASITDNELEKLIVKQVAEREGLSTPRNNAAVKTAFSLGKDDARSRHRIVNVDGATRETLVRMGRLFRGWESHRVRDWVKVRRCNKCQNFGHTTATCKSQKEVCGHCTEDHKEAECPNKEQPAKCGACKHARKAHNHRANERCPSYVSARNEYIRRTNYAGEDYVVAATTPI